MTRFAWVFVAACATPPAPAPAPARPGPAPASVTVDPPSTAELSVGIQVLRVDGVSIKTKDAVPTGTEFAVILDLSSSAYVYVVGLDAAHRSYLRVPQPNDSAELKTGRHRIPERETRWLVLKPPTGPEVLFVIASRRPIADVDASLAQAVGELPVPDAASPAVEHAEPTTTAAARVAPKRAPRNQPGFTIAPERLAGLTPRGELKPRTIEEEDLGPLVVADQDGVVVY